MQHLITDLPLPQTIKWGPLGPLFANLTPTKHVQAVEVNKIQ